jgi:hypothetical protein
VSLAVVFIIAAAIVVASTIVGAILKFGIDDKSHTLGAWVGFGIGGWLGTIFCAITIGAHFLSKYW